MSAPTPEPQPVGPLPVPQQYGVQVVDIAGSPAVLLTFLGPCGQWCVFLDAASTKGLAGQLERAASQAGSGLIVPNGLVVPPAGGDGRG